MTENKAFIKASSILVAILLLIAGGLIVLYVYSDINLINTLMLIFAGALVLFTISIIIGILLFVNNIKNSKLFRAYYFFAKTVIIPAIKPISKAFGIDTENLDRFFIQINNKVVQSQENTYKNSEVVLLLPHCLQNSSCNVNITHDINNCKRCGKCNIDSMIQIAEKYGIKLLVVTGGTAARAQLSKLKPSAVVAVACERDLASGINDVTGIPVYGVLNMRPNGPCNNTEVDMEKIEEAIKCLMSKKTKGKYL